MRITYLTQTYPSSNRADITIPAQMTEAMTKRGHQVLVIAVSNQEYSYHIYRNNITVLQLRSLKCPVFIRQQPIFLPFLTILQSLYRFQPDILYMDVTSSMNWIGYVYAFIFRIPTRSTPQPQIKAVEQN